VVVWQDPRIPAGDTGGVYACSRAHPGRETLLTVRNPICPSPTGCHNWARWSYTAVRFAGGWVAVSAAMTGTADKIAVWNAAGTAPARVLGTALSFDASYDLRLRADGALAYGTQITTSSLQNVDILHACASGCPGLRSVARYVEPGSYLGTKPLLSHIEFGPHDRLEWRYEGRARDVRIA
jgi:hypothetical protein